jgi:hypothetical protein
MVGAGGIQKDDGHVEFLPGNMGLPGTFAGPVGDGGFQPGRVTLKGGS